MGNGSSRVRQKYNTKIVNRSDIEMFNEHINDFVSNIVMESAAQCSANLTQIQTFDASNVLTGGDFNLKLNQLQKGSVTFGCLQTSAMTSEVSNGILGEMLAALENNFDTDVLADMAATAETEQESGFLGALGMSAHSSVDVDSNINIKNEMNKSLRNTVKNLIENNLNLETLQECLNGIKQRQDIILRNITARGNADIELSQEQTADIVAECVQQADFTNNMINEALTRFDIKIDESSTTRTDTRIDTAVRTEQIGTGLFEGIGAGLGAAFSGIGNMFSGIFTGMLTGMMMPSLILCCCCILISVVLAVVSAMGGGGGSQEGGKMFVNYVRSVNRIM